MTTTTPTPATLVDCCPGGAILPGHIPSGLFIRCPKCKEEAFHLNGYSVDRFFFRTQAIAESFIKKQAALKAALKAAL
jgi:hypothetical protein